MIAAKHEGDTLSFTITDDELMRMGNEGVAAIGRMTRDALTRRRNVLLCERNGHEDWLRSDAYRVCGRCYLKEEVDALSV